MLVRTTSEVQAGPTKVKGCSLSWVIIFRTTLRAPYVCKQAKLGFQDSASTPALGPCEPRSRKRSYVVRRRV